MKHLEIMINNWLRPMWEAASGGRTHQRAVWRLRRKMTADMVSLYFSEARIVSIQSVFDEFSVFPRGPFARRRRPPTLVGSKVLSNLIDFSASGIIRYFHFLGEVREKKP
jgi:hypothetical protein